MVTHVPRAPRVAMEAPMLIRRSGDPAWHRATTINISRTGILLRTHGLLLDAHTSIELTVTFATYGNLAPGSIHAKGRIVRVGSSKWDGAGSVMAARLDEHLHMDDEPAEGRFVLKPA